jgi:hypothetical protein
MVKQGAMLSKEAYQDLGTAYKLVSGGKAREIPAELKAAASERKGIDKATEICGKLLDAALAERSAGWNEEAVRDLLSFVILVITPIERPLAEKDTLCFSLEFLERCASESGFQVKATTRIVRAAAGWLRDSRGDHPHRDARRNNGLAHDGDLFGQVAVRCADHADRGALQLAELFRPGSVERQLSHHGMVVAVIPPIREFLKCI